MRDIATATVRSITYTEASGWSDMPSELDSDRTLLTVFSAHGLESTPGALNILKDAFPNSHAIGCSTSGEIDGAELNDESISVGIMQFQHTDLTTVSAPVRSRDDSERAGRHLGEQLVRPGLQAIFVIADGHETNGTALTRGLRESVSPDVIITGGMAGDGTRFGRTWVLLNGKPTTGFATAIGLYGDRLNVGYGSCGGWSVFGPERRVTRADGPVLRELDGKPALALYKEYLGDFADQLPASALRFPLEIRRTEDDEHRLVRTIISIDEADQSMTFAGDIPEGHLAQLMRANFDSLLDGAEDAAHRCRATSRADAPCLAIAVSCVGRRLVLGERTEEELERTLGVLPQDSVQVGFYSYGEIGPFASGAAELQNQTMSLITFTEL
ncbi:MAG: FIST signal transduction protein [Phycisphaerales bacterium]